MKTNQTKLSLAFLTCLFLLTSANCAAPKPTSYHNEPKADKDLRMSWWREARFGMFIHWGLYAIPAGEWQGKTNHAEWIRHSAKIPVQEYDKFVQQFNPVKFNADQWVKMAKRAGMKYLVITSKHHDGFCLWDTKQTEYDVMSTPFRRDVLQELTKACKRHDVRMCFYHSIMDWHHPDYLPRRSWEKADRPEGNADFNRYIPYMKNQLREIIANYDPGVLWFDGEWEDTWTHEMGIDLYDYVRGLKSDIIINNRVDKGRRGMQGLTRAGDYRGDFGTPEQEIPDQGLPGLDWESCMTMNAHWGWNKNDQKWKSSEDLIRKLIDIASKGGNFLLNIGPKADGTFPTESIERLEQIGKWMDVNGESIYATTASPFAKLPWGRCTKKIKSDGAILYLHVFDWPSDGELLVPGLKTKVKNAFFLAGDQNIKISSNEDGVVLGVPAQALDTIDTVIVLQLNGELKVEKVLTKQKADGTLELPASIAEIHDEGGGQSPQVESKSGKPNIGFWLNQRDWVEWKFKIDKPGTFDILTEIATPANNSQFTLKVANQTIEAKATNTGDYAKFTEQNLGRVKINQTGKYNLEVRPGKNNWKPINLRQITLKPK